MTPLLGYPGPPGEGQKGAFLPRPRPGPAGTPKTSLRRPKKWSKSGIWAFLWYSIPLVGRKSRFLAIFGGRRPGPARPGRGRPGEPHFGPTRPGRAGLDPQNGQNHEKTPKNTFFPEMAGLLVQGSFLPRNYAGLTRFSRVHVRSSAILFWCF